MDDTKYPNLKGERGRVAIPSGFYRGVQYDTYKPPDHAYQAIFEANLADQPLGPADDPSVLCLCHASWGLTGRWKSWFCPGPPTSGSTYIRDGRRIYTDGRDILAHVAGDPQLTDYSIGRWTDEDGDGRYDLRVVETRD